MVQILNMTAGDRLAKLQAVMAMRDFLNAYQGFEVRGALRISNLVWAHLPDDVKDAVVRELEGVVSGPELIEGGNNEKPL